MTDLKQKILDTVEKNKVKMIPKWKFALYSLLGVLGAVFSFLAVAFLLSLAIFLLSTSGFVYMPAFGLKETVGFLISVPVFLFIVAIAMIFVTETLVRQHEFAFRKPILITLLSVTFLSVIIGFFVSQTPMHFVLRDYAREHHMGMMRGVYERPLPFSGIEGMTVIKGVVLATSSSALEVRLYDDRIVIVRATGTLPLPLFIEPGVGVAIFGVMNDDASFEAFKVKPLGQGSGGGRGMMREINFGE